MRAGGHIRERDGALALEGFIGDRLVAANIAAVNNSIHIFTQVYMYMYLCIQCTCIIVRVCVYMYTYVYMYSIVLCHYTCK